MRKSWEVSMSKKPQVNAPLFEIKPSRNGQSWSVLHINKSKKRMQTYEFTSEKAASNWINYESKAWLKKYDAG
jgi:hypothetical protein